MRSGNSLVDTHEDTERRREESKTQCSECQGERIKHVSKDDLLQSIYEDCLTVRQAIRLYHEWKKNKEYLTCDNCEGEGYVYEF